MTKAHIPTEIKVKRQKRRQQNFNYTRIADRLRMVSRSNFRYPTAMDNPVNEIPPFQLEANFL